MQAFLQIALGFPTFIFGVLLLVMLLYWLIALAGMLEHDALDHWLHFDTHHDGWHLGSELAGLLLKVGLGGIPLTVILTMLLLFSWLVSYVGAHFLQAPASWGLVQIAIGLAIMAAAVVVGFAITVVVLRPVRRLLQKVAPDDAPKILLGRSGLVRSAMVSPTQGYGSVEDGGAGLNVQMRTAAGELPRGTEIVLIERLAAANAWLVVSKDEFEGLDLPGAAGPRA